MIGTAAPTPVSTVVHQVCSYLSNVVAKERACQLHANANAVLRGESSTERQWLKLSTKITAVKNIRDEHVFAF